MNELPTCPECGKSHLSVATRCPSCGHVFRREPFEQADYRAAAPRGGAWVLGALALLAAAGIVWYAVSQGLPTPPAGVPAADRPAPEPVPAIPPATDPVAADTAPARDPVPLDTAAPSVPVPAPALAPPVAAETSPRWTTNWANVRESPDLNAPVTTILRPGERIDVGERLRGFVRVYRDARPLGFVALSLLATTPPDTTPR